MRKAHYSPFCTPQRMVMFGVLRCNEGKVKYRAEFRRVLTVYKTAAIEATPMTFFASRQAVRGILHVIAGWLGHSTTWMTERYAHFSRSVADINDMSNSHTAGL